MRVGFKNKNEKRKGKCQECTSGQWWCTPLWSKESMPEWLSKYNVTMTQGHTAPTALFCNISACMIFFFYLPLLAFLFNLYLRLRLILKEK